MDASTKPFAVNPDPNLPRGIAVPTDVRAGTHLEDGGWDRIVIEFNDSLPGAELKYVDEATYCGFGQRVARPSSAVLLVRFSEAQAHTDAGKTTVTNCLADVGAALLEVRRPATSRAS